MEIKVIGCSTSWTDRPTSSYCLDDKILIDCGEGTIKHMNKANVNFANIENIFITHFHGDHIFGVTQFLCQHYSYRNEFNYKPLTIYGPVGLKKHLDMLKYFAFSEEEQKSINLQDYINIVEINNFGPFKVSNYVIKPFKLKHGQMTNIAYIFEKDGKTVGFSGDCTYNENVEEFAKNSNLCFLECCSKITSPNHLGYDKFIEIKNRYNSNRFLAIHCNNSLYENQENFEIEFAKEGKCYNC